MVALQWCARRFICYFMGAANAASSTNGDAASARADANDGDAPTNDGATSPNGDGTTNGGAATLGDSDASDAVGAGIERAATTTRRPCCTSPCLSVSSLRP